MRTLITGGTVVTMDLATGDLACGDVLITDGVITEAAEQIDAPDAEVIDATGRIVLPDFVDTHRHTWQTQFCELGVDWTFDDYMTAIASAARVERCRGYLATKVDSSRTPQTHLAQRDSLLT